MKAPKVIMHHLKNKYKIEYIYDDKNLNFTFHTSSFSKAIKSIHKTTGSSQFFRILEYVVEKDLLKNLP